MDGQPTFPLWPEALAGLAEGSLTPAEVAAIFVHHKVRQHCSGQLFQGLWNPPLQPARPSPFLTPLATSRWWRISKPVVDALLGWHAGERNAVLCLEVVTPRAILEWQAQGRRCVTLLQDESLVPQEYDDALDFASHDLCHLEKFHDPEHHHAQVGFFASVLNALDSPQWRELDATLDARWIVERDDVLSDMNGSVVFLLAALKMKLKMAVRRHMAMQQGIPTPSEGPLNPAELSAYLVMEERLLEALQLPAPVFRAARTVSKRRDAPECALRLVEWFHARGEARLAGTA